MKKLISAALILSMLVSVVCLFPSHSYAEEKDGFFYELVEDKATLTGIADTMFGDINIPAVIDGHQVTRIAEGTFSYRKDIYSVNIPEGVTNIDGRAFAECEDLKNVSIPSSVAGIDQEAFFGCTALENIYIPGQPISIGPNAFANTAFAANEANKTGGVLYLGTHLLKADKSVSGSVSVKDGTTDIAAGAFSMCEGMTGISIPDSVGCIGASAFYETPLLLNASDEFGVRYIDGWVVMAGFKLTGEYTIKEGTRGLASQAFYSAGSLTKVIIPDTVKSIGEECFRACNNLEEIEIPDGVEKIFNCAFMFCMGLKRIVLPASLKYVGHLAFEACQSLRTVLFLGDDNDWAQIVIGNDNEALKDAARFDVFNDVQAGKWYTSSALWCSEHGYISGTGGGNFSPSVSLTRAMFVQILAKAAKVDLNSVKYTGTFFDVPENKWYTKAVEWAAGNGITSGTGDGYFSPDKEVTREQLATFLYAYSGVMGYDRSSGTDLGVYDDASSVSGWAETAVSWAVAERLISGKSASVLAPKDHATRAQAAVIFRSFIENYVARQSAA